MFLFEKKGHRANGGKPWIDLLQMLFGRRQVAHPDWEQGPQAGVFAKRRKVDLDQIYLRQQSYPPGRAPTELDEETADQGSSSVLDLLLD